MADIQQTYEREIVGACLQDKEFLNNCLLSGLQSKHFQSKHYGWAYSVIVDRWRKQKKLVTPKVLKIKLANSKVSSDQKNNYLRRLRRLYKLDIGDVDVSLERIQKHIDYSNFIEAIDASTSVLEEQGEENIDQAIEVVRKRLFRDSLTKFEWEGQDFLGNFVERQRHRKHLKENPDLMGIIETPFKLINKALKGGMRPGWQLALVGNTNVGKSIICLHCSAHSFLCGKNVIHFTNENSLEQTLTRLDARVFGLPYNSFQMYDFDTDDIAVVRKKFKTFKKKFKNKFIIAKIPEQGSNILNILDIIDYYEANGIFFDQINIDSPQLMAPISSNKEYRLQRAAVHWDYKAMLMKKNASGIGTVQTRKEDANKITYSEGISESYDIARLCDLIITINQDVQMAFKKQAILFLAKNRDGEKFIEVPVKTKYSLMTVEELNLKKEELANMKMIRKDKEKHNKIGKENGKS